MIPAWVAPYVGLPFQDHGRGPAYDCWGLVKMVLREHYAIQAPDFGDLYEDSHDRVGIPTAFNVGPVEDWRRVDFPQEGDVVILRVKGRPMHCGLVVGSGYMLHAHPENGSCLEPFDSHRWTRRIDGFYRHASR